MANPDDRKARTFVRSYLADTCGVTLREVDSEAGQKSVDFEMMDGSDRVLVAELKTFKYRPPSVIRGGSSTKMTMAALKHIAWITTRRVGC